MFYTADRPVWTASCAVCNRPVNLEVCKVDERGRPVHEECYAHKIQPAQSPPQSRHRVIQLPSFLGHYRV
jgi:hypothetical protein